MLGFPHLCEFTSLQEGSGGYIYILYKNQIHPNTLFVRRAGISCCLLWRLAVSFRVRMSDYIVSLSLGDPIWSIYLYIYIIYIIYIYISYPHITNWGYSIYIYMWIKSTWSFLPLPTGTTLHHDIMTFPFFLGSLPHLRPKPLSSPHMGGGFRCRPW